MSILKRYDVMCDLCKDWSDGYACHNSSEARKLAKRYDGYNRVRINGVLTDVCSECAKELLEATPNER
jgi:hypothetical protein